MMPRYLVALLLVALLPGCDPVIDAPTTPPSSKARGVPGFVTPIPKKTDEVSEKSKSFVGLPGAPVLSVAGYKLILDFEVGGGKAYYDKRLARPTWPGYASGVTVGVGYDCGYNSKAVILDDWQELPSSNSIRLAATSGITGKKAEPKAAELRSILVRWEIGEGVFQRVSLTKFYETTKRVFPGFEELRPNAQAALVSLVFNRGSSMIGNNRSEMREIKKLVPKKDYAGIAAQLRAMVRIWKGADVEAGLTRRRMAEAKLVELP